MRYLAIIFILSFCWVINVTSQGQIDEQEEILFRDETTVAAMLSSNGFGGNVRYAKNINIFRKTIYDIDLAYVKNPKEQKNRNYATPSGRNYVYGKKNVFINLRGGYGLQRELFRKMDKGSISIRLCMSAHVALGILKPIYYEISTSPGTLEIMKFSDDHPNIQGRASFFKGFDELSVVPGTGGKVTFSFDYSTETIKIQAIETGVIVDIFPKKIPIMAYEYNKPYFISLFAAYRIGKAKSKRTFGDSNELINF